MQAQQAVDNSINVNATELAQSDAITQLRDELANTIECEVILTSKQRKILDSVLDINLKFSKKKQVFTDHSVLAAIRNVVRQVFCRDVFDTTTTLLKTLVVGSAFREINAYGKNPIVDYYIHGSEGKDIGRTIEPMLSNIVSQTFYKLSKKEKKNLKESLPKDSNNDLKETHRIITYRKAKQVYDDFKKINKMPGNIFSSLKDVKNNYFVLTFEDSFYNLMEDDYFKLFENSGATVGYAYGMLPLELLFPEMAPNKLYGLTRYGGRIELFFRNGYCEGYNHNEEAWSTLLKKPVMRSLGYNFVLVVETKVRFGPFAIMKITKRPFSDEIITRRIELPDDLKYVRVLDIFKSYDYENKKMKPELSYFSVLSVEFYNALNYALVMAEKSLSITNVAAYIRRIREGVSLATQSVLDPWELTDKDSYKVAAVICAMAWDATEHTKDFVKRRKNGELGSSSIFDSIKENALPVLTYVLTGGLSLPISNLYNYLTEKKLIPLLVKEANNVYITRERANNEIANYIKYFSGDDDEKEQQEALSIPLNLSEKTDTLKCPICAKTQNKLGKQKLRCGYKKDSYITFKMSDEQVKKFFGELADDDNDPKGLADVKGKAKKSLPLSGFEVTVRVENIKGAPGCGKSFFVRSSISSNDLVFSPFMKLRSDYVGLKVDEKDPDYVEYKNKLKNFFFQTSHRAMTTTGHNLVVAEEWTSVDYRMLACTLFRNQSSVLYLVGDINQTKLQGDEGVYIGSCVGLNQLSTHELTENFRNPRDIVRLLNKYYNYKINAQSDIIKSISIEKADSVSSQSHKFPIMTFKDVSAKQFGISKNSVRSNQGGTIKGTAGLLVSRFDSNLLKDMDLFCVAISRHTEKLIIFSDDSQVAKEFISKLDLDVKDSDIIKQSEGFSVENQPEDDVEPFNNYDFSDHITQEVELNQQSELTDSVIVINDVTNRKQYLYFVDSLKELRDVKKEIEDILTPITTDGLRLQNSINYDTSKTIAELEKDCNEVITLKLVMKVSGGSGYLESVSIADNTHELLEDESFLIQDLTSPSFNGPYVVEKDPSDPMNEVADYFKEKKEQVSYDAFSFSDEIVPSVALSDSMEGYNSQVLIPENISNGKMFSSVYDNLNTRGHPKEEYVSGYSYSIGHGLRYDAKNPRQVLQCAAKRYLGRKKNYQFDHLAKNKARKMVKNFVNLCVDQRKLRQVQHMDVYAQIAGEYNKSATSKQYGKRASGEGEFNSRLVRFSLKSIFKPEKNSKIDVNKAGQGISAWSAEANLIFGAATRIANNNFKSCLKDNVIFNNGISSRQLNRKIKNIVSKMPSGCKNAVLDGKEFDSMQNRFTQEIERQVLVMLGFSEKYIEWYYSFRNNYTIVNEFFIGRCVSEKTSGEPGTLLFNSAVIIVIAVDVVSFKITIFYILVQGDDILICAFSVVVLEMRLEELKLYCSFQLTVDIENNPEFCGYTIMDGQIAPNLYRKLKKIVGHKFSDEKHFHEYRQSLIDFVNDVYDMGVLKVMAINCSFLKTNFSTVVSIFEAIRSFSHFNTDDFYRYFSLRQWTF